MQFSLVPVNSLVPTEEVNPDEVIALRGRILRKGYWTRPIMVHKQHMLVMDGHHRLQVAQSLNLTRLPAFLLTYDDVDVGCWRADEQITPECIISMALRREKFPYKTTKHIFRVEPPAFSIGLDELRKSQTTEFCSASQANDEQLRAMHQTNFS